LLGAFFPKRGKFNIVSPEAVANALFFRNFLRSMVKRLTEIYPPKIAIYFLTSFRPNNYPG
jgi:NAD dependent epimerase/dehydratase family enzyme